MAAFEVVATSSAAVLSAKRLAASSAFAEGSAGLVEYFGSMKAKSAAFPAAVAVVAAGAGTFAATGASGTVADASSSLGVDVTATGLIAAGVIATAVSLFGAGTE